LKKSNVLRQLHIKPHIIPHAEGSCMIQCGKTTVICTATVETTVPAFLKDKGKGWLTAEYGMLPRATQTRTQREASKGKQSGRTVEISRLIGRSLRAALDLTKINGLTVTIDCDVLIADGGTRCASITGGMVALALAIEKCKQKGIIQSNPIINWIAAVSVGIIDDKTVLDLCYEEDSKAVVDMNIIMTNRGEYVEIQGTAEHGTFTESQKNQLCDLAKQGIRKLIATQKSAVKEVKNEISFSDE